MRTGIKSRGATVLLLLFCAAEMALSFAVQLTSGRLCAYVSYSAVVLAFLFCLSGVPMRLGADKGILTGLAFTLAADMCLVVMNPIAPVPAMFFFNGTQLSYGYALWRSRRTLSSARLHIILRTAVMLGGTLVTAAVLGKGTDLLSVISVAYYASLLLNLVIASVEAVGALRALFRGSYSSDGSYAEARHRAVYFSVLAVGLLCFAICDVFVGLDNLKMYFDITKGSLIWRLTHTGLNMAWVFYVPSQTLIAIAGRDGLVGRA